MTICYLMKYKTTIVLGIYIYISGHENYVMRLHTSRLIMIPNPKYVPGHMSINWALIFRYDQHT